MNWLLQRATNLSKTSWDFPCLAKISTSTNACCMTCNLVVPSSLCGGNYGSIPRTRESFGWSNRTKAKGTERRWTRVRMTNACLVFVGCQSLLICLLYACTPYMPAAPLFNFSYITGWAQGIICDSDNPCSSSFRDNLGTNLKPFKMQLNQIKASTL